MKKSSFKYLFATLLLVIFGCITFLPFLTEKLRERTRYSVNKEKIEKEGKEKDSSDEKGNKDDLSVYLILTPNDDHLICIDIKFVDQGKSILPTRILSVLSPPPDQV